MKNIRNITIIGIILAAIISRFISHPPNFTPILAICLFGGAMIENKKLRFLIPITIMFLSDLILGMHNTILWVYGSLLLIVGIGVLFHGRIKLLSVILGVFASSLLFFLVTNFGVWFGSVVYPQTLSGLGVCYAAGIPFFKNTITSNLFFSGIFFVGYALLERKISALQLPSTQS